MLLHTMKPVTRLVSRTISNLHIKPSAPTSNCSNPSVSSTKGQREGMHIPDNTHCSNITNIVHTSRYPHNPVQVPPNVATAIPIKTAPLMAGSAITAIASTISLPCVRKSTDHTGITATPEPDLPRTAEPGPAHA